MKELSLTLNKGKDHKAVPLSEVDISTEEKASLIAFHAFTGNDYVSAFFLKINLKRKSISYFEFKLGGLIEIFGSLHRPCIFPIQLETIDPIALTSLN